jgi:hypothetical protein
VSLLYLTNFILDDDQNKKLRHLSWLLSLQDTLLRPLLEGLQLPLKESDDAASSNENLILRADDIDLESATQIPRSVPPTNVDPLPITESIMYSPRNADNV